MAPGLSAQLRNFSKLPPVLSAAVVAGLVSLVVSPLTATITKRWERSWQIEQEHRQEKIPVYEEFMAFWFRVMSSNKPGATPVTQAEMATFLTTFTQKLVVWGSDDVLRKYSDFQLQSKVVSQLIQPAGTSKAQSGVPDSSVAALETLKSFERLLYTIRADIGHRNKGLKEYDLLRLFINDLDDVLTKMRQTSGDNRNLGSKVSPG